MVCFFVERVGDLLVFVLDFLLFGIKFLLILMCFKGCWVDFLLYVDVGSGVRVICEDVFLGFLN